jgi:hypothetical protein
MSQLNFLQARFPPGISGVPEQVRCAEQNHTEVNFLSGLIDFHLKAKTAPLHATKALGRRGGIAPTHS